MPEREQASTAEWLRTHSTQVVVVLSLLVLVVASVVATTRGKPEDASNEVLQAEPTSQPQADDVAPAPRPALVARSSAPATSPTSTPTTTPTASASASATAGSPTARPSSSPPARRSTSVTPGPTRTTTVAPTTPVPTTPVVTTPPPASTSGEATVLVVNDYGAPVTFRVNGALEYIAEADEATITFSLQDENTYMVQGVGLGALPCRSSGSAGFGLRDGGSYRVVVVRQADPCGDGETGKPVLSPPGSWPAA